MGDELVVEVDGLGIATGIVIETGAALFKERGDNDDTAFLRQFPERLGARAGNGFGKLEVFVVAFEQDKLILRVPVAKAASSGMRALASTRIVGDALKTLGGRARIKRTMWSRRAQEYEAKINSGNLIQIAEVVRDLHRAEDQPDQSYSERQLYESALDRMARELAAVENIKHADAVEKLAKSLAKRAA